MTKLFLSSIIALLPIVRTSLLFFVTLTYTVYVLYFSHVEVALLKLWIDSISPYLHVRISFIGMTYQVVICNPHYSMYVL